MANRVPESAIARASAAAKAFDPYLLSEFVGHSAESARQEPLSLDGPGKSKKWDWDGLDGLTKANGQSLRQSAKPPSARNLATKRKGIAKGLSGRLRLDTGAKSQIRPRKSDAENFEDDKPEIKETKLSVAKKLSIVMTKNKLPDRRSAVDRVASKPRHWQKHEDQLLRDAVAHYGNKHWKKIAERVPGRNHTQCLQRWSKVLAPGLKKGQWSKEEDETLIKTAQQQIDRCLAENTAKKLNWGQICKSIPGRTAKQCRERWVNNLNPEIRKGDWTPEEDERILELHQLFPKKWAMISKHLQGRTENSVKIRYKTLARGPPKSPKSRIKSPSNSRTKSENSRTKSEKTSNMQPIVNPNTLPVMIPVTLANKLGGSPKVTNDTIANFAGGEIYEPQAYDQSQKKQGDLHSQGNSYSRSWVDTNRSAQSNSNRNIKLERGHTGPNAELSNIDILMNSLMTDDYGESSRPNMYNEGYGPPVPGYEANSYNNYDDPSKGIEAGMSNLWQGNSGRSITLDDGRKLSSLAGSNRSINGTGSLRFPTSTSGSGRKLSDLLKSNSQRSLNGVSSGTGRVGRGNTDHLDINDLIELTDGDFDSLYHVQAPT